MEQLKFDNSKSQNSRFEGKDERMEYLEGFQFGGCYRHFGSCFGNERCEIKEGEGYGVLESWQIF